MVYPRYFAEKLLEHLYVVGEMPHDETATVTDCHVYLIEGETTAIVVDSGSGSLWPFIKATAQRFGFADKPISDILVTHGHRDHAGGLPEIEAQGALTISSEYTASHLESAEDTDLILDEEGLLELEEFRPLVVFTPGHTPGSTSYILEVDGVRCLFTGDLIQMDSGLGWCGSEGFSQEHVLTSLKRLAAMPEPGMHLGGHGFTRTGLAVIERGIAYGEGARWVVWTESRPRLSAD